METAERALLRSLAKEVREIAGQPVFDRKRELWRRKNRLIATRPLILCSLPEEVWPELIPPAALQVRDPFWREIEWHLRKQIYRWQHIKDDEIISDRLHVPLEYSFSDWCEGRQRPYAGDGRRAEAFHPVIRELGDLKQIRQPELISFDRKKTAGKMERIADCLGDILTVIEGEPFSSGTDSQSKGWGVSGIDILCELRGLDNVLTDCVDNPGFIEDAMAFICQGLHGYLSAMEENGLLRPNNNEFIKASNTPLGSNGLAVTDELPRAGSFGAPVRCAELWGYMMAQEFAGVSPEMHARLVLAHQKSLGARFGLLSYGCCEPNDAKWDTIAAAFPNLREVSVSHCADLDKAVEKIGTRYVFSWKPNSSPLTFGRLSESVEALRAGMQKAKGCHLVVCLRDTLTFNGHPDLPGEWTRRAMEMACEGGDE